MQMLNSKNVIMQTQCNFFPEPNNLHGPVFYKDHILLQLFLLLLNLK